VEVCTIEQAPTCPRGSIAGRWASRRARVLRFQNGNPGVKNSIARPERVASVHDRVLDEVLNPRRSPSGSAATLRHEDRDELVRGNDPEDRLGASVPLGGARRRQLAGVANDIWLLDFRRSPMRPIMRTTGVVASCALATVLALPAPASAQVLDFATMDVPGASSTFPRGINPRGDIVGFYGVGGAFHAFLFHEGTFTDIDVPGASFTRPRSINPQGDIVGFYGTSVAHGFLLVEGSLTTIDVPGASATQPFGINSRGDIVGSYSAGGVNHGFLLSEGTFSTIDVPGASATIALGINPQGDIVGQYTAAGITHGFLLDKHGNLTTIDVPGATATIAQGINPEGDIVGTYTAGGTTHGFLAR